MSIRGLRGGGRCGTVKLLQLLESAIRVKKAVRFAYTNAKNETRSHMVEPVAAVYRYYAWYLAYSRVGDDYRTYRLVRMRGLEVTDEGFTREHGGADAILRAADKASPLPVTAVKIRCKAAVKARAVEYLGGKITEELENGDALMTLRVIEQEHFWLGTMLSLGGGIEILEPEGIRDRVLTAAKDIVSLYAKL